MPIANSKESMCYEDSKNISPRELLKLLENSDAKPFLVDVREQNELDIVKLPFAFLHLPLSESSQWISNVKNLLPSDRPVVVFCHLGVRSLNFCLWLDQQGLNIETLNLIGGIDAWSLEIDQSLIRY